MTGRGAARTLRASSFRYAPGRGGKHGDELLRGFSGTVQVDGYSGHNVLA